MTDAKDLHELAEKTYKEVAAIEEKAREAIKDSLGSDTELSKVSFETLQQQKVVFLERLKEAFSTESPTAVKNIQISGLVHEYELAVNRGVKHLIHYSKHQFSDNDLETPFEQVLRLSQHFFVAGVSIAQSLTHIVTSIPFPRFTKEGKQQWQSKNQQTASSSETITVETSSNTTQKTDESS